MDETSFMFQHKPVKICARKGAKNVPGRTSNTRTSITVLAAGNAAGNKMPPMIVTKGKTSKALESWSMEDGPAHTVWTYQEAAWMNGSLGEGWFKKVFLKHCGPLRPQILILDGHSSHETLGLLEAAREAGIHVLALPPHTTAVLQPLDRSVFGPMKEKYNQICSEYMNLCPDNVINKKSWPGLFKTAFEYGLSPSNIISGFRACGIFPFNPKAIDKTLFSPCSNFNKPNPTQVSMPAAEAAAPEMANLPPNISSTTEPISTPEPEISGNSTVNTPLQRTIDVIVDGTVMTLPVEEVGEAGLDSTDSTGRAITREHKSNRS